MEGGVADAEGEEEEGQRSKNIERGTKSRDEHERNRLTVVNGAVHDGEKEQTATTPAAAVANTTSTITCTQWKQLLKATMGHLEAGMQLLPENCLKRCMCLTQP